MWIKLPDESDFVCTLPIEDAALANPQRGEIWRASWPAERTMIVREQ